MNAICERLNIFMKENNLRRVDVAAKLGISQSAVSQMCSGTTTPSPQTIRNLSNVYHLNEKWMLYGEEPMYIDLSQSDIVQGITNRMLKADTREKAFWLVKVVSEMTEQEVDVLYKYAKMWIEESS